MTKKLGIRTGKSAFRLESRSMLVLRLRFGQFPEKYSQQFAAMRGEHRRIIDTQKKLNKSNCARPPLGSKWMGLKLSRGRHMCTSVGMIEPDYGLRIVRLKCYIESIAASGSRGVQKLVGPAGFEPAAKGL